MVRGNSYLALRGPLLSVGEADGIFPVYPSVARCRICDRHSFAHVKANAPSMRRPARVKPFFLGRAYFESDCRPTGGAIAPGLSLLGKVLCSAQPIQPVADQREAHSAATRNSQITDSPYFHPHSLWGYLPRCQLGVLNWKTGAAVSYSNRVSLFPTTSFLARAAVTRTRRSFSSPVSRPLFSVAAACRDSAMARTREGCAAVIVGKQSLVRRFPSGHPPRSPGHYA
jgi:hypothetical protein